MSKEARKQVFHRKLDALLMRRKQPGPVDIVEAAQEAGLSAIETIHEVHSRDHGLFSGMHHSDKLACFISALCEKSNANSVLEYNECSSFLTAGLLASDDTQRHLHYSSPNEGLVALAEALSKDAAIEVITGRTMPAQERAYDAIVCAPAFGTALKSRGDKSKVGVIGYGGNTVLRLHAMLADSGTLYWVTGQGATFSTNALKTRTELQRAGLFEVACIDVAPGVFWGTALAGVIFAYRRIEPSKKFVGVLRDRDTGETLISAFLSAPTEEEGACWAWLDPDDPRTFSHIEQARLLEQLMPRGQHIVYRLRDLLLHEKVERADQPVPKQGEELAYLFVPEYAQSRATADIQEQSVKPKAVYRLAVNPEKADAHFIARLLNSPYGKEVRARHARGTTIQRLPPDILLDMALPVPDLPTQKQIARVDRDIQLLLAAVVEMQEPLDNDWTALPEIEQTVESLNSVLDIDQQIADWSRELPYPLATIYRRYQIEMEPTKRLDALMHFFEVAAAYLAILGASHVRALSRDWQIPVGAMRPTFGFWISFADSSFKKLDQILVDTKEAAEDADVVRREILRMSEAIVELRKATEFLDVARRYRNNWPAHGGLIKDCDAEKLDQELFPLIQELYGHCASVFRRIFLVRPIRGDFTADGLKFQIEILAGNEQTFERRRVELAQHELTGGICFWLKGARAVCHALPLLRLGTLKHPEEKTFYLFNQLDGGNVRWVSYQEAREQEFFDQDEAVEKLFRSRS